MSTHHPHVPGRAKRPLRVAGGLAIAASAAVAGVAGASAPPDDTGFGSLVEVVEIDTSPEQSSRVRAEKVDEVAALIPEGLADDGQFVAGVTAGDFPPLVLLADDETTFIGNEVDIAQLVADVLGLELVVETTSWEDLFLKVEGGQYDAGFSNITVTEERKDRYDFATYRIDQLAWSTALDSGITAIDGPADISGLTVGVGAATNQEQVLLTWNERLAEQGLPEAQVDYYQGTDYLLALESGRLDAYFGPAPSAGWQATVRGTTHIVGTAPGGGDITGYIAAQTAKDSGWVEPIAAALNSVIESGEYFEVLEKWGVLVEAVERSEINPPGLPRQDEG